MVSTLASRTVTIAVQHAQIGTPRTDGRAILVRHDSRNLVQVGEVVNGPGRHQLRERNTAESRMPSTTPQILRRQLQCPEFVKVRCSQGSELIQELAE